MKKYIVGTALSVVVLGGLGYAANIYANNEMHKALARYTEELSQAYIIKYDSAHYSLWNGGIYLNNIAVAPKAMPDQTVSLKSFSASGFYPFAGTDTTFSNISLEDITVKGLKGTEVTGKLLSFEGIDLSSPDAFDNVTSVEGLFSTALNTIKMRHAKIDGLSVVHDNRTLKLESAQLSEMQDKTLKVFSVQNLNFENSNKNVVTVEKVKATDINTTFFDPATTALSLEQLVSNQAPLPPRMPFAGQVEFVNITQNRTGDGAVKKSEKAENITYKDISAVKMNIDSLMAFFDLTGMEQRDSIPLTVMMDAWHFDHLTGQNVHVIEEKSADEKQTFQVENFKIDYLERLNFGLRNLKVEQAGQTVEIADVSIDNLDVNGLKAIMLGKASAEKVASEEKTTEQTSPTPTKTDGRKNFLDSVQISGLKLNLEGNHVSLDKTNMGPFSLPNPLPEELTKISADQLTDTNYVASLIGRYTYVGDLSLENFKANDNKDMKVHLKSFAMKDGMTLKASDFEFLQNNIKVAVSDVSSTADDIVDGFPQKGTSHIKGIFVQDTRETEPFGRFLKEMKMSALEMDITANSAIDFAAGEMKVDSTLAVKDLADLRYDVTINGIDKEAADILKGLVKKSSKEIENLIFSKMDNMEHIIQNIKLKTASVALQDKSGVEKGLKFFAETTGQTVDGLKTQVIKQLEMSLDMAGVKDNKKMIQESLTAFLNKGGTLTVKLDPKDPLAFPALFVAALMSPDMLLETLGFSIAQQ